MSETEPSRFSLIIGRDALIEAERSIGMVFSLDRKLYDKAKGKRWREYWSLAHQIESMVTRPSSIFMGLNRDGYNDDSSLCYCGSIGNQTNQLVLIYLTHRKLMV